MTTIMKIALMGALALPAVGMAGSADAAGRQYNDDNRRGGQHARQRDYRDDRRHARAERKQARKHARKHARQHSRQRARMNRHSGYGVYYNGRPIGRHYRHHRRNAGNVALGIGLGLLTYQALKPKHYHTRDRYIPVPVQAPPQQSYGRTAYTSSAPLPAGVENCLQVREYQTTVIIGGREAPAYGNACLQPDGSWIQGPPVVEPQGN